MERHVSLLCTCCHHEFTPAELLASVLPYMMLASMLLYVVWAPCTDLATLVSQSAF